MYDANPISRQVDIPYFFTPFNFVGILVDTFISYYCINYVFRELMSILKCGV
jgi:hypothetical protein